jgi:hypothetical protein
MELSGGGVGKGWILALALAVSSAAPASGVTLDLVGTGVFPHSQDIEGAKLGVLTLTSYTGQLRFDRGWGVTARLGSAADIILTFDVPVRVRWIRAGDGCCDFDAFGVTLFAFGSDLELARIETPVFGGGEIGEDLDEFTLDLEFGGVGRVVFDPGNGAFDPDDVQLPGIDHGIGGVPLLGIAFSVHESRSASLIALAAWVLAPALHRGVSRDRSG